MLLILFKEIFEYESRKSKLKLTIDIITNIKKRNKRGLWETRRKNKPNIVLTMIVILQYNIEKQNNLRLLLLAERSGRKKKQSCWVKKGRTLEWCNKFVNNEVPESDWKENFRMSSSSFKELCNKLKPFLQKNPTRMTAPISVEIQVVSFLYYIS